jgi:desulfoferrodoxin-like iron-binding protein
MVPPHRSQSQAARELLASAQEVDKEALQNYNKESHCILKGGADMANEMGKRYRCTKCGTELIVTRAGTGKVVCCKQPMEKKT